MVRSNTFGAVFVACYAAAVSDSVAISVSKEGPPEGSVHQSTTFSEHDQRFAQIVNYDDESVDSIPFWTKDFQYVRPSNEGGSPPDSVLHVPEIKPVQEQYTGLHAEENELFRREDTARDSESKGVRVASGLQVDENEKQYQARGPNPKDPTKGNSPGTVPLCRFYKNSMPTMQEWNGTDRWTITMELGVQRLTTEDLTPVSKPTTLFLRDHACNAATISTNVRVDANSVAGITFRAESDVEKFAVLLDTSRRVAMLTHFRNGKPLTISEVFVSYMYPDMRHQIEVVDHGAGGSITVYLDGRSIITYSEPFTGIGNMGILIEHGHAIFDTFSVSP